MLDNSGMSNTSDFILKKEDHTLGNLLSEHLKAHPNVYMAGYKGEYSGLSCCTDSMLTFRKLHTPMSQSCSLECKQTAR
jgi:hypothetical protein